MRAAVLLVSVVVAIGLLFWQAPQFVPRPVREGVAGTERAVTNLYTEVVAPSKSAPVWPEARDPGARKPQLQIGFILAAAGVALAGLAIVLWIWRFRSSAKAAPSLSPPWMATARGLASASRDGRERRTHCDVIEKNLIPDMTTRGEAALARAHQLDLYARFAVRNPAKGAQADRLRVVAKQTLEAIAVSPMSRATTAFRQTQPSLWALEAGDAREIKRYYEQLGALLASHDEAWKRAHAAADKPSVDAKVLSDSMEELRQINRAIAKESAALVGDIEISVRALN